MATCTIFNNEKKPVNNRSLILIANDIESGKYKAEIEEIRTLLEQGKKKEADEFKEKPAAW